MAFFRNNGGTWAPPKALHRNVGGSWVPAKVLWRNVGGTWRQVWSALSVDVYVVSYRQVRSGGSLSSRYYDQITFGVRVNGTGTPSSYRWGGDTFGTAATVVFNGPVYDTNEWTYQTSGTASVTVVIGGQSLNASLPFFYSTSSNN